MQTFIPAQQFINIKINKLIIPNKSSQSAIAHNDSNDGCIWKPFYSSISWHAVRKFSPGFLLDLNGFPWSVSDWDAISHGEGGILHVLARVFSCSQFWALFNWRHTLFRNPTPPIMGGMYRNVKMLCSTDFKIQAETCLCIGENLHITKDSALWC